jgi:SAM-dependent methyltransferase
MPDVRFNAEFWAERYDWVMNGEEWSAAWGSSSAQWFGTILPRIRSFVPAANILEIAPGFGRWTRFLATLCDDYYGVDISSKCIDYCRERFALPHMRFFVNDGTSLSMIPEKSVDFAFSFDSLVHADAPVIEGYVGQLISKLSPKGAAFIHHSNLGGLRAPAGELHMRDPSVSARLISEYVSAAGGQILCQEIVKWGGVEDLDCLSLFSRLGAYATTSRVATNRKFMDEAIYIRENIAPWNF